MKAALALAGDLWKFTVESCSEGNEWRDVPFVSLCEWICVAFSCCFVGFLLHLCSGDLQQNCAGVEYSSEGWAWPLYGILILPQIVPWTMLRQDANLRHASCEKCVADSDFDCAALRLLHFSCAGRHPWRRRSQSAPRAKTERRRV